MPRRSQAEAQHTRERIVARALELSTVEGLEGVTIGRLAEELGMSKAGVIGHFGTKEALQLSVVVSAADRFTRDIWEPVVDRRPGLERLLAACDAWVKDVAGRSPGGCFWTAASMEMDGRAGPVRDAIAVQLRAWHKGLAADVRTAVEDGELPSDTDPDQVAFELRSIIMGLNQEVQLMGRRDATRRARQAMRRAIGVGAAGHPEEPRSREAARAEASA